MAVLLFMFITLFILPCFKILVKYQISFLEEFRKYLTFSRSYFEAGALFLSFNDFIIASAVFSFLPGH